MTRVVGIVPAAGHGSRFGGAKLIAPVDGRPMLERTVRGLLDAGLESVILVLADRSEATPVTVPVLTDPRVACVVNSNPDRGMFSTVQIGLAASAAADVVIVLPGDMPFVLASTTQAVAAAVIRLDEVAVASYQGRRGHPVGIPARLRDRLVASESGSNLSDVLKALAPGQAEVQVDDAGVLRDVDRVADL